MIVGLGLDLVDVERFAATVTRCPRLGKKLLTPAEQAVPPRSQAARFAAKEAVAKALGSPGGLRWHDCEVTGGQGTPPQIVVRGTVAAAAAQQGITRFHVSLTHDGRFAAAVVVAEQ